MADTHRPESGHHPPGPRAGLSEPVYRAIVIGAAALLAAALVRLQFCGSLALPDKPERPEAPELAGTDPTGVARAAEANPIAYRGFIERDSERYQLDPPPTPEELAARFEYRSDTTVRALELDVPVDAAGLVITASVSDVEGSSDKQLTLTIANPGDAYLAYHVVTEPEPRSRLCDDPPNAPHNAMTLPPASEVVRSECWYHPDVSLTLRRVEVMELPRLSYHYVGRVPPNAVGIPNRLGKNHVPPVGRVCSIMLPAKIASDLEAGRVSWRDVVDFYARHRCDSYRYPDGYRAFEKDGERPLPAVDG